MAATDWTPIVVPVVTASISFVAAVVAVVVGQELGRKSQRITDEARWKREDALRRRTRSEEMAREATDWLAEATELVGWTAGYARGADGPKRTYVGANLQDITARCRPVRRAALEIDDEPIRRHLEKACDVLESSGVIQQFGGPRPGSTAWVVQQTSELLVSAYLRDTTLPSPLPELHAKFFKRFDRAYAALEDYWSDWEDEGGDEDD
jgi:hypothetical protein